MKGEILLAWAGKTRAEYAQIGIREYLKRIRRYRECRVVTAPEQRHDNRYSAEHRVDREGDAILARLGDLGNPFVVALDGGGSRLTSRQLAELLQRQAFDTGRPGVFVVGGPDGLSSTVRNRADRLLAVSALTLPHDMARLLIAEQVYRALTILHGHPYDR